MKNKPLFILLLLLNISLYAEDMDFGRDIYPIFSKNCTICHNKLNGVAPLSFETYSDVVKNKKLIEYVLEKGIMPPWKADTGYSHFKDERVLNVTDREMLIKWLHNKQEKKKYEVSGDKSRQLEYTKKMNDSKQVVLSSDFFNIKQNTRDSVIYIKKEFHLKKPLYANSITILLSNPKLAHHINITFLKPKSFQYDNGYYIFNVLQNGKLNMDTFYRSDVLFAAGWVPGTFTRTMPADIGYYVPDNFEVVFECHVSPTLKSSKQEISIRFDVSDDTIRRTIQHYTLGSFGNAGEPYPVLLLPPDSMSAFVCTSTLEKDMTIVYINPHMHYLGKSIKAYAVKPNQDTIPLIRINNWDFNWQEFYKPFRLIVLPKGTTLYAEALFDNTINNPFNPNTPPKFIKQGTGTFDEMINLNLDVVDYNPGDELILNH